MGIIRDAISSIFGGTPTVNIPPPAPSAMPPTMADPTIFASLRAKKRFGTQPQTQGQMAAPATATTTLLGG